MDRVNNNNNNTFHNVEHGEHISDVDEAPSRHTHTQHSELNARRRRRRTCCQGVPAVSKQAAAAGAAYGAD